MVSDPGKSSEQIRALFEERQRIEQWLERLNQTPNQAPDHVKAKVESDYRRRLAEVLSDMGSYRNEISEALESQRLVRDGLTSQELEATERLHEAELRHTVGEYDDQRWSDLKLEIDESLEKTREELKNAGDEVVELEEVMTLLDGSTAALRGEGREPAREAPESSRQVPELESILKIESDTAAAIAGEPARAEPEDIAVGKTSLDELEFLRSVTEDQKHGPAPERASGEMKIPDGTIEEVEMDELVATSPAAVGAEGVTSFADTDGQPKKAAAKTLKCGECGTMNLPTEWYCERCGAELAAL